jgi:rare lipoprotein A
MYKMTAAHPVLPIPSYARLTNMVSGAVVIVRINDRGPFHANRAIDVSYTAALKLGCSARAATNCRSNAYCRTKWTACWPRAAAYRHGGAASGHAIGTQ